MRITEGVLPAILLLASATWAVAQAQQANSMSDAAQQGRVLIAETRQRLPEHVGNGLNCTSCHLDFGTRAMASSWVGIAGQFPEYSARHGSRITLQQRINDCFERSMNGKPLALSAQPMQQIVAYLNWLSADGAKAQRGFGGIDQSLHADRARGQRIYTASCAACHGGDGTGIRNVGGYAVPPLWGVDSFNDGAGMARSYTAAAFVKRNMPLGHANTLSDQDAIDVAEYFTHQPRPVFAGKSRDWPHGDKPLDARN